MLEMIVAADIDHRRGLGLGGGEALAPMGKDLTSEFQPLAEGVFQQESAVYGKLRYWVCGTIVSSAAAVQEPVSDILLQPERNFVPNLSHAESLVVVAGR